jgi:predicted RNA-binding Zn-ribbon protein involved in translation (DUF1610 family)
MTLPVTCARCHAMTHVRIAGDGQPVDLDPAFAAPRLLEWFAFARAAMAAGTPGLAVSVCASCRAPLLVSSRQTLSLSCPHCGDRIEGPAAQLLIDQWTEPWARVDAPGTQLEYRLSLLEEKSGDSAGCAACGAPAPVGEPSGTCPRCGATTWVAREGGRMQLAVRIDGTRDGRPYKALFPIVAGEAMLRTDAVRGTSARSAGSLLSAAGIGCATTIGALVLIGIAVAIATHFVRC